MRDDREPPPSPRKGAIIGLSLGSVVALALFLLRFCSFEGLSELLTMAFQFGWFALVVHFGAHLRAGYHRRGVLPWEMALESLLVVAWGAIAVALQMLEDPKLLPLLIVWSASTAFLFALGARIEDARKARFNRVDRPESEPPLPRSSQVLRESRWWAWVMKRIKQTEDPCVEEKFENFFPEEDNEDGNLTKLHWKVVRVMAVIVLITGGAASAEKLAERNERNGSSGAGDSNEERGGGGPDGAHNLEVVARRRVESELDDQRGPENEDCDGEPDPSGRMPSSIRRALSLAWHDVRGAVPDSMEALGYDIGGCPGPARRIPGLASGWYAPGYCDGDLRMLSIAFEGDDHPVVLLEQAADFSLPIIRAGRFLSAEDRFEVGEGDAYVIDTRDGSYVPIRDTASRGLLPDPQDDDGGCRSYQDEDVAYTVAGPGLLDPWRSVAATFPGGIYPIDVATDDPGRPRVALRSTATGILTTAACDAALLNCEIRLGGQVHVGEPGSEITSAEVKALAEGGAGEAAR